MKVTTSIYILLFIGLGTFIISGCDNPPRQGTEAESEEVMTVDDSNQNQLFQDVEKAVCVLHPTEGNNVSGTVTFTRNGSSITVEADVEGLTPGLHGFHIHEYGDCSAADGTSAGGHFNPDDSDHGGPNDEERHVGDLGNIEAGQDGRAQFELTDSLISFTGANSIIGRAVVVHAGEDDLTSQPTGDAGGRLACGIIGVAE